jgi:uncharacterized SAM-dependent methyltransferase
MLESAYDDRAGVTAAFNKNVLLRINRELGANFRLECFDHKAVWNAVESRIEMHLVARHRQRVHIPANCAGPAMNLLFEEEESIHTENSYKFTCARVERLLDSAGFVLEQDWQDPEHLFAVNLATAI